MDIFYQKAKKQHEKNGGSNVGVGASDNEIFNYAAEYYILDDNVIEEKKAAEKAKAETKKPKTTAAPEKKPHSKKPVSNKAKKAKPKAEDSQMTLF